MHLSTCFISRPPSLHIGAICLSARRRFRPSVSRCVAKWRNRPGTVQYILRPLARHEALKHYSTLYFNQLFSLRFISFFFPAGIIVIFHPSEKFPSAVVSFPFSRPGRSWKRCARRKAEEEFIAGDMCDATRRDERNVCTYVRTYGTYERAPRIYVCVPTYTFRRFQRGATSGNVAHTYTGARVYTRIPPFVGLGRADGPESPTFRGHGERAQRARVPQHSRRSRRADYGPRDLSAPRDTSSRTRLFRARTRETARP